MASLGPRSVVLNESTDGRRVDVINEGGWLNGVHEIGNWVATMCRDGVLGQYLAIVVVGGQYG